MRLKSYRRSRNGLRRIGQRFACLAAAFVLAGCLTPLDFVPTGPAAQEAPIKADGTLMAAGDSRVAQADLKGAVALYRSAHDGAPMDPEPLKKLGLALGQLGSFSDASLAYAQAIRLDPHDPESQRGMGNMLIGLAQPGLAEPYFLKAIDLAPNDWRAYLGLGVLHDLSGDPASARQSYEAGLALVPDNPELLNNYALSMALDESDSDGLAPNELEPDGLGENPVAILKRLTVANFGEPRFRGSLAIAHALAGDDAAAASLMAETETVQSVNRNLTVLRTIRSMTDHARKARLIQAIVLQ